MNSLLVLAAIAGIPVVVALVFRVSAVFLFLGAVSGSLLVSYVGDDLKAALDMVTRSNHTLTISEFGLLLVPILLTLLFLRKTMPKSKVIFNIVPLVVTGLAIGVLVLPYMQPDAQAKLFATPYGRALRDSQDVLVAAAALLNLFLAWTVHRSGSDKHSKGHK